MTEEKPTYDVQGALAIIQKDRSARQEEAVALINAALEKYHCILVAVVRVGDRDVPVPVQVVAQ